MDVTTLLVIASFISLGLTVFFHRRDGLDTPALAGHQASSPDTTGH